MNMFSNWTVGKRLVAGFGLSALTLVVIAAVSYYNTNRLIENDTWVKHTYQVRSRARRSAVAELKDAETGVARLRHHRRRELSRALPSRRSAAIRHACRRAAQADRRQSQSAAPLGAPGAAGRQRSSRNSRNASMCAGARGSTPRPSSSRPDAAKTHHGPDTRAVSDADQEEAQPAQSPLGGSAKPAPTLTMMIILWGGLLGTARGRGDRLVHHPARSPQQIGVRGRPGAELLDRAAGRRQPAGDRRQGAGDRDDARSPPRSASCWRRRARSPRARSAWPRSPSRPPTRRAPATARST